MSRPGCQTNLQVLFALAYASYAPLPAAPVVSELIWQGSGKSPNLSNKGRFDRITVTLFSLRTKTTAADVSPLSLLSLGVGLLHCVQEHFGWCLLITLIGNRKV